ncbi:MAG: hypothetical protein WBQ60_08405 [Asticcacaulis sp.]
MPGHATPSRRTLLGAVAAIALWPLRGLAQSRPQKEVLAFYYGWYGIKAFSGQNIHWKNPDTARQQIADAPDYPSGGPYDSLDPAIMDRQMAQMKAAGITGLIASWWGQDDRTNQQLPKLLDAAARYGLKVCAYVERADTPQSVSADVLYLHQTYGRHAAWLRLDGKPVLMFFDRLMQTIGPEGWNKARALIDAKAPRAISFIGTANTLDEIKSRKVAFDGLHIYSMQFEAAEFRLIPALWRHHFYKAWVKAQSGAKVTTATILPGFDDHLLPDRTGKRPTIERDEGESFRRLWKAAIDARPDWILIVSFNEWHEASQIEPSLQYGTRELETCKTYSVQFMSS